MRAKLTSSSNHGKKLFLNVKDMIPEGLEPPTFGTGIRCSAN